MPRLIRLVKRVPMLVDVDAMIGRIPRPLDEKTRVYVVMLAVLRAAGAVMAFRAGNPGAVPIKVLVIDDRKTASDDEPFDRAEEIVLPRYAARRSLSIEWEAMSQTFPELAAVSAQFEHHRHVLADVIADDLGSGSPGVLGRWMRSAYEEDQAERKANGEPLLADAPGVLTSGVRSSRIMSAFFNFASALPWAAGEPPWNDPRILGQAFGNWLNVV